MTQSCPSRPCHAAHLPLRACGAEPSFLPMLRELLTPTFTAAARERNPLGRGCLTHSVARHPPDYWISFFKPHSLNYVSGRFSYKTSLLGQGGVDGEVQIFTLIY